MTGTSEEQQEFAEMAPPKPEPRKASFTPRPSRRDPAIWVRKLSVWSAWPPSPKTELRTITLRRGLNILWAESKDDAKEPRIGGHGAGKTTFCRFLRFILDERFPGTEEFRKDFRRIHDDGWVLAEVIIENVPWLVGKTLGDRGRHHFAIRGADLTHPFDAHVPSGGYDDYSQALEDVTTGRVSIKALSGSRRPVKWVYMLAWLARDQEAHYANLLAWRDTASEPEGQDLSAVDRENLIRLVLGLLTEQTEQDRLSERAEASVEHENKVRGRARLDFFRERARSALSESLGQSLDQILGGEEVNDPVDPMLLEIVRTKKAAWESETASAIRNAGLEGDLREAEDRVVKMAARARVERFALTRIQMLLAELEPTAGTNASNERPTNSQMFADATRLEKLMGEIRGLCNNSRKEAEGRCPIYKEPGIDAKTERAIAKQEQRDDDEEAETRREIQRLKALFAKQASIVAAADQAEKDERSLYEGTKKLVQLQLTKLSAPADRAKQLEAALTAYQDTCKECSDLEIELGNWQKRKDELDVEITMLAEAHHEIISDFGLLFEQLAKELLGDDVQASVRLGKGILPTLQYGAHRRKSAALNLATLLAFDLACLALGMTCERAHHPRFLIHDSPRESDLAIGIYRALFRAARMLENACDGEPAFQYIITTTEAPPKELNCAPWRLDPVLDASQPRLRFLGLDLG